MSKNQFTFGCNVVRDPEVKTFKANGKDITYTSLTVALNHPRKPDAEAKYIECQFYDKFTSEIALKMVKGERAYVTGELSWDASKQGKEFLKLSQASFAPGWLPPRKDTPAYVAPVVGAADESTGEDDLPF